MVESTSAPFCTTYGFKLGKCRCFDSRVIKCIRKVLNAINEEYLDSGMTSAYLMKKYVDVYDFPEEIKPKLVLLCLLKNIGCFYQNEENFDNNPIKAAASIFQNNFVRYSKFRSNFKSPDCFTKSS